MAFMTINVDWSKHGLCNCCLKECQHSHPNIHRTSCNLWTCISYSILFGRERTNLYTLQLWRGSNKKLEANSCHISTFWTVSADSARRHHTHTSRLYLKIELNWGCDQLCRTGGGICFSIRDGRTCDIQPLPVEGPEFLPEHLGHDSQAFHVHFWVQGVALLGHHDSHAVNSGSRVVDWFLAQRSSVVFWCVITANIEYCT